MAYIDQVVPESYANAPVSISSALWLHIDGISLLPGEYIVSIQALDDDPRITGLKLALSVGTKWK
jgi:hypothetical protein